MPAVFTGFTPLIIPLEGDKLTDIEGDAGGLTKYGISKVMHPEVDVANLDFPGACRFYEINYWNHYGLSRFDSQEIANKLMSFIINENPFSAIRCLQRAINHCGGTTIEDGLLGTSTTSVANSLPQAWLLDRFRIEGALFYLFRVKVKPDQTKFLEGWGNRALS